MNLSSLVITIVILGQLCVCIANTIVIERVNTDEKFYKDSDLVKKRDSVYNLYTHTPNSFQVDSTRKAILADNLINHIIPDGKDLSKSFLTLIVAVFVAAITFSEKVVQFSTAHKWTKALIFSSWIFLSIAILICGLGIIYLMYCQGRVLNLTLVYQKSYPLYFANDFNKPVYLDSLNQSTKWFMYSGMTFGIALVTLMIAGIVSNSSKSVIKSNLQNDSENLSTANKSIAASGADTAQHKQQ